MGNERVQLRRQGTKRKGPRERAADLESAREALRVADAERQRRRRELQRGRQEEARRLASVWEEAQDAGDAILSMRDISAAVSEIVNFFISRLQSCPDGTHRLNIVEGFLEDDRIAPFLPDYYPRPGDAKVQFEFLKNYRQELDAVKGAHSADMLARKAALLDAAVSTTVTSTIALSRILRVHPSNLRVAIERRRDVRLAGTPFALARRKKRPGVPDDVKVLVVQWWTQETRVSPNRKEIVRKWLRANTYEKHCTHYLLETQVIGFKGVSTFEQVNLFT